jgi:hypothetical protein
MTGSARHEPAVPGSSLRAVRLLEEPGVKRSRLAPLRPKEDHKASEQAVREHVA